MKLLIDGVEIPWPRKIEIQVAPEGEAVRPLLFDFTGGTLKILATEPNENAVTWRYETEPSIYLENVNVAGCKLRWDGDKLVPVEHRDSLLDLREARSGAMWGDEPEPDAVTGG